MKMSSCNSRFGKVIFRRNIFLLLKIFSLFLSTCIKRKNYKRPKYHPIIYFFIKWAENIYKLKKTKLLVFSQYLNTIKFLPNIILGSKNLSEKRLYSIFSFWPKINHCMILKKYLLNNLGYNHYINSTVQKLNFSLYPFLYIPTLHI